MKKLYEFTVTKVEPVIKKEPSTNDKGDKVITETTVDEKIKYSFFLRKPTRALYDEAELFYGIELSKGIKAGLLTKALLAKRYENDGGSLSDGEIERYGNLYLDFYRKTDEYQKLLIRDDDELSDKERDTMLSLESELQENRSTLTQFEMEQQSLYEQTAEVRARNKTILWWILHLSHDDNGPYFKGKTFEEKLEKYDDLSEEEDIFTSTVIQRLTYFVSFWFVGRAGSQEEFDQMLKEQGFNSDLDNEGEDEELKELKELEALEEADQKIEEKPELKHEPEPDKDPEVEKVIEEIASEEEEKVEEKSEEPKNDNPKEGEEAGEK